jgi:hypothetical protein
MRRAWRWVRLRRAGAQRGAGSAARRTRAGGRAQAAGPTGMACGAGVGGQRREWPCMTPQGLARYVGQGEAAWCRASTAACDQDSAPCAPASARLRQRRAPTLSGVDAGAARDLFVDWSGATPCSKCYSYLRKTCNGPVHQANRATWSLSASPRRLNHATLFDDGQPHADSCRMKGAAIQKGVGSPKAQAPAKAACAMVNTAVAPHCAATPKSRPHYAHRNVETIIASQPSHHPPQPQQPPSAPNSPTPERMQPTTRHSATAQRRRSQHPLPYAGGCRNHSPLPSRPASRGAAPSRGRPPCART